jgi:hypothetical protein
LVIVAALAASLLSAASVVRQRHDVEARRAVVMRAVAESIGTCSLALSCQGAGARQPLEGPAGCLGDVPAGYCLGDACDVVTCPGPIGRALAVERARAAR